MDETLNKHEAINASDRDSKSPVWDMSQERVFIENLLNQRFNFFIIFFSITIAGFVKTENIVYSQMILTLGAVIAVLLASVLRRSQQKLDLILQDLFTDDSHPAKIIDDRAGGSKGSKRRVIGILIPTICYWSLIIGAVVHLCYIACLCHCK